MKVSRYCLLLPISVLLLGGSLTMARAQGGPPPPGGPPQGGAGPGGGRFQMTPEMKKKMDAMQAWNKKNPDFAALSRTVRGLSGLDRDPATALTKAQARQILPVLDTWHSKPVLTEAQAKMIDLKLTGVLSTVQKQKIAEGGRRGGRGGAGGGPGGGGPGGPGGGMGGPGGGMGAGPGGPRGGGMGGPGGPGMGAPGGAMGAPGGGGPGGPGGGRRGGGGGPGGFTIPDPKPYNPLNPDTLPNERGRARAKERMDKLIVDLKTLAK